MKKLTAICMSLVFLLSAVSCESKNQSSTRENSYESANIEIDSAVKLTNHMTEKELQNVSVGELTVFYYEQIKIPEDGIYFEIWSSEDAKEYWSHFIENHPDDDYFTEEKIQEIIDSIDENYDGTIHSAFVDGHMLCSSLPSSNYDGGEITYFQSDCIYRTDDSGDHILDKNGNEITQEEADKLVYEVKLNNFDEVKTKIHKDIENMVNFGTIKQNEVENEYERTIRAWEAIINKSYVELEYGTTEKYLYQDCVWEIEHAATKEIADFVTEISIYDEELDTNFIVHVTLPPDFDPEKTYPAFVLTDGVWRFGNHPALRKEMENGNAGDALLVSIGYDYSMNGMDDTNRKKYFCEKDKEFLDFITDNLMPYLGEQYNVDFSNSTLYGHSLGGTFAHYAIFNSDKYENQPFGNYIIGSPAFWSPGFLSYADLSEVKSEYGYFDRNDTLDKRIFICAGADEDPVYEEYYGDNDSTLEGVENLTKRLESYGFTNFECKLYPGSGHYEFIPEMLNEVLAKFCPADRY